MGSFSNRGFAILLIIDQALFGFTCSFLPRVRFSAHAHAPMSRLYLKSLGLPNSAANHDFVSIRRQVTVSMCVEVGLS